MRMLVPSLLAALVATPALGGDFTVDIRNAAGQPLANAVVMVKAAGGAAGQPVRYAWPMVMSQQNVAFTPYVLVVPVGSTVSFPNKDKVRHHVYSFSPAKKFELKLYGRDESRSITFDRPGIVSIGCNIHDGMIAFIYVADTPYAAKTGADGSVTLRGVPAGAATLTVWHPDQKAKAPALRALSVTAAAQRNQAAVELRAAR